MELLRPILAATIEVNRSFDKRARCLLACLIACDVRHAADLLEGIQPARRYTVLVAGWLSACQRRSRWRDQDVDFGW